MRIAVPASVDGALDRFRQIVGKALHGPAPVDPALLRARHLERLALLSPHLLADCGFGRDAARGAPEAECWRRGPLRVTIARGGGPSASASDDRERPAPKAAQPRAPGAVAAASAESR